jgi:23S rRNA (adenine2030-N6)-methyltransferase
MNYRHAFHAGNFADVMKHAVLCRILLHLAEKPGAFRVIDTHAGAAIYDLTGSEAERGGEWKQGIARLRDKLPPDGAARGLLAPYLDAVASFNPDGRLRAYPGSPAIVRALLRPQDKLIACELEPQAADALAKNLSRHGNAKAVAIDGWLALKAYVPPPERRGLVLIDPAFEQPGEFVRLAEGLVAAHRKWPSGIYLAWYPVKDDPAAADFVRRMRAAAIPKILRAEFAVAPPRADGRLSRCGLAIVNPPWRLDAELAVLLPALAAALATEGGGAFALDWIAREK